MPDSRGPCAATGLGAGKLSKLITDRAAPLPPSGNSDYLHDCHNKIAQTPEGYGAPPLSTFLTQPAPTAGLRRGYQNHSFSYQEVPGIGTAIAVSNASSKHNDTPGGSPEEKNNSSLHNKKLNCAADMQHNNDETRP